MQSSRESSFVDNLDVPKVDKCDIELSSELSFNNKLFILLLLNWSVKYGIHQNAFSALLKVLREHNCFKTTLPKDCRTLFGSGSSSVVNIKQVSPGKYYHFGLAKGIEQFFNYCTGDKIKISIDVDGLPLTKSSSSTFWPILGYIFPFNKHVFPIGIFWGNKKPTDSNKFMDDFVNETKELIQNGIVLHNKVKKVSIFVFSCDTPAKSFLLKTKGHSGFNSCNRCIIGEYFDNKVCFHLKKIVVQ